MSWTFDRAAIRAFRFTSKRFDAATGEIALGYAFVNHDGTTSPELVERIAAAIAKLKHARGRGPEAIGDALAEAAALAESAKRRRKGRDVW